MHVKAPPFQWVFLHPKYWLTWISIFILYSISWLPYRVQQLIGAGFGHLIFALAKKRRRIAERNLELCFPNLSAEERGKLLKEHRFNAGMALLEAGMGWWWPNWRLRKHGTVVGFEHVERILKKGKGVLGIATHNMNLEFGCRLAGLRHPSVALYRRHNNPVMEFVQYRGRAQSNKYMLHKKDIRGFIQTLDDGEVTFYLPDQDYGRNRSLFVPLFAVPDAATTTGTLLFAKEANCETVFIVSLRKGNQYQVVFLPGLENFPSGDDEADLKRLNQQIEKMILLEPAQYLWMHKRFKTRPDETAPSLYD